MKETLKIINRYVPIILFGVFIVLSSAFNFKPGQIMAGSFEKAFVEMISLIPCLFIIVGLLDVWFPRERVERHIGQRAGIKGIALMVLLAMLQAGPLYGAFPVSYILYRKGAGARNIFIYLGAFSSLKIPMLGIEFGYMGWRFCIARALISLPLFIGIGFLMEYLLRHRNFEVMNPAESGDGPLQVKGC